MLFRRQSEDQLSPTFDDPRRTLRKPSAIFGLVSTIVGGGVLSLPYAFSQTGLVLGASLLVICACASDYTVQLLVECARRTGAETYEELALHAYGRSARVAVVSVIGALTWISTVAYLVLITDMLTPIARDELGLPLHRQGVMLSAAACVCPLCLPRSLQALRFTSVLCVVAVLALAGCIAYRSLTDGYAFAPPPDAAARGIDLRVLVWPASVRAAWHGALHALPIFCVSFLCHFNVLSTHTELHEPSRGRIAAVVHQTMALCCSLYLAVGVLGYLHRLGETRGDVLLNFAPDDAVINGGRGALALVLFFSTPLLVLPCRDCVLRLLAGLPSPHEQDAPPATRRGTAGDSGGAVGLGMGGGGPALRALKQPLVAPSDAVAARSTVDACCGDWWAAHATAHAELLGRVCVSACVLGSSTCAALLVPDIVAVWSLLGSSIAMLVAFLLPAVFFLRIRAHKPWRAKKLVAVLVLVVGTGLAVVGTQQALHSSATPT